MFDYDQKYIEGKFRMETPPELADKAPGQLCLTPFGWVLYYAASAVKGGDKLSAYERICIGLYMYQNKNWIPDELESNMLFVKVQKMLHQLRTTGSTNMPVDIDAVASGVAIVALSYGCETTLKHILGEPMSASEAFYTRLPDVYTMVNTEAVKAIPPHIREAIDPEWLKRSYTKAVVIPATFGSSNSAKEVFAKCPELIAPTEYAVNKILPVLNQHKMNFRQIQFRNECVEWTDMLGRNISIPRDVTLSTTFATPKGNVDYSYTVPKDASNSEHPFSELSMLANTTHNLDSTVMAALAAHFAAKGIPMHDIHDCVMVHPIHMNEARVFVKWHTYKMIANQEMRKIFNQIRHDDSIEFQADIENVKKGLRRLRNTHLLYA